VVKLLREPLLHFLLLGFGLFLLSSALGGSSGKSSSSDIVVTSGRIASLVQSWQLIWQRPPTESELQGLIQDYVREEVLCREAISMSLDKDDTVIRNRLRQKMEFLADDTAEIAGPTREDLERYLRDNVERFQVAPRVSFQQVYVSRDRHGDETRARAEEVLRRLRAGSSPAELSERISLPAEYELQSPNEVARTFGDDFSREIFRVSPGSWTGPIESGYGLHLVLVARRDDGRAPKLDEVRDAVAREWIAARRKETNEAFYKNLLGKYSVRVERFPFPAGKEDPADAGAR
jgi:PPIC-type PPIASE domain